jgi:twitching motility protein PilT
MQLLDEHMFRLWKEGLVEEHEVLIKANNAEELAARIARAKRGLFDDEEDVRARAETGQGQQR